MAKEWYEEDVSVAEQVMDGWMDDGSTFCTSSLSSSLLLCVCVCVCVCVYVRVEQEWKNLLLASFIMLLIFLPSICFQAPPPKLKR